MGRGLGGRERDTGSCGLPAVPTRSQPNGKYRLTPRANLAHGRSSSLLTRPGQVHGRHRPCSYAPMAHGRGQNSRTDWGRPRPRLPSLDLLDHGCSSHGTSHSRHQQLLPTYPAILVLVLVLNHFRSRPWPWPSPPAPPSRFPPPTIVLACSQTRPHRLLASAPALGRLFPQPSDVWQPFKEMKRQRKIARDRGGC